MFGRINKRLILVLSLLIIVSQFCLSRSFSATVKDTDFDGISDEGETKIYFTDPTKEDTDGDGVLDYQEILDNTNPLDSQSNALAKVNPASPNFEGIPLMWTIGRVAGISAFILFTLVICMGLLMTAKFWLKFRFITPPQALENHSFTATFIAFALLIVHFSSLMFDDFIKLKPVEILVPFVFKRELKSALGYDLTLPISLGIIAFYLAVVLLLTSHLRNKIIPSKLWRLTHYSSFVFYILFLLHGYFAGSDSEEPWMLAIYIGSVVIVFSLILLRIFGKQLFLPKRVIPTKPTTE